MIERQIPEFDVLYENFRPGVMDRLGLSYERCERGTQPAHHLRVGHGIWAGRSARRQAWSGRSDRSPHRVGSAQQRGRQAGSGRIRGGRHARGDERCIRNACAIVHAVRRGALADAVISTSRAISPTFRTSRPAEATRTTKFITNGPSGWAMIWSSKSCSPTSSKSLGAQAHCCSGPARRAIWTSPEQGGELVATTTCAHIRAFDTTRRQGDSE